MPPFDPDSDNGAKVVPFPAPATRPAAGGQVAGAVVAALMVVTNSAVEVFKIVLLAAVWLLAGIGLGNLLLR